jgi:hypothetical protein
VQDASSPLPSNPEELDEHLADFEAHFKALQHKHGFECDALLSVEKAIIASYIAWLRDGAGKPKKAFP